MDPLANGGVACRTALFPDAAAFSPWAATGESVWTGGVGPGGGSAMRGTGTICHLQSSRWAVDAPWMDPTQPHCIMMAWDAAPALPDEAGALCHLVQVPTLERPLGRRSLHRCRGWGWCACAAYAPCQDSRPAAVTGLLDLPTRPSNNGFCSSVASMPGWFAATPTQSSRWQA